MMRLFVFLLFALPLCGHDISQENKPITVKVLIEKLIDDALIEVKGRCYIYNPKNNELLLSTTKSKRAKMTTKDKGLYWGDLFTGIYELRIVPSEKNTRILVGGIQYKGCIEIYSIGGTLNIVNEVDGESYLKSILGPKVDVSLSNETLEALAITERTNLYFLVQKDNYASWQVEAAKVGYTGEASARQNKPIQDAVDKTRDLFLSFRNKPFLASWGMNHAGKTVSYSMIFRRSGNVPKGVEHLPSTQFREKSAWKLTVAQKDLTTLTGLRTIKEIDLFKAEKSEKVYAVRFIGEKGCKDIDFFTLQKAFGENQLPSNDFSVIFKGKKAYFKGYGRGSGVGLCIKSAETMARGKSKAEEILAFHFPETKLLNQRQESGQKLATSHVWQ